MYLPRLNAEHRLDVMHALISAHPLGTWVLAGEGALVANHIPFQLDPSRGEFGTLVGHVARANPVWKSPATPVPSVVIFQGPQAYITPSWYPSKLEHGRAVPTWNYAVVHVHGHPTFIEDLDWLHVHVSSLTDEHEAAQAHPWHVDDAPVDYTDSMKRAIVGVEIPIVSITGKWKTTQNRDLPDKRGVVAGLQARGDSEADAMASLVRQHIAPPHPPE